MWLLDHAWTYESLKGAEVVLQQNPALAARMHSLLVNRDMDVHADADEVHSTDIGTR